MSSNYETQLSGQHVGSLYDQYKRDGKEPSWGRLLKYNKDDVFALREIVEVIQEEVK